MCGARRVTSAYVCTDEEIEGRQRQRHTTQSLAAHYLHRKDFRLWGLEQDWKSRLELVAKLNYYFLPGHLTLKCWLRADRPGFYSGNERENFLFATISRRRGTHSASYMIRSTKSWSTSRDVRKWSSINPPSPNNRTPVYHIYSLKKIHVIKIIEMFTIVRNLKMQRHFKTLICTERG